MDLMFLSYINYGAVVASAIALFILGALWFSAVFSGMWVEELRRHGVVIKEPTTHKLLTHLILNFLINLVISFAMACLLQLANITTVASAAVLGLIVALGFSASAIASVFLWESRSIKLFLIDAGYQVVGVTLSAIILSFWV